MDSMYNTVCTLKSQLRCTNREDRDEFLCVMILTDQKKKNKINQSLPSKPGSKKCKRHTNKTNRDELKITALQT